MTSARVLCAFAIAGLCGPDLAVNSRTPAAFNDATSAEISAALASLEQPQDAPASSTCALVPIPAPDPKTNMFTSRQEEDLGDAIAEQMQRNYLVIDDDDVTAYLRHVGGRLLAQAPTSDFGVQFYLFDLPIANALTLPGGRIYVSRKLIAMTRSEDELAAVLGHELGHALTHQTAQEMTRQFREVMGVTTAGTREEIFHTYEALTDKSVTKRKAFRKSEGNEQTDQLVADQLGLQMLAKAGYTPQAFPDFFDRLANTKGNTGGWLSDFFGATRPDSRRLREMQKQVAVMPVSCKARSAPATSPEYQKWQAAVVSYIGLGHKEELHELFSKTKLNPPLQSDIWSLRISPDGKYLLAQDEATIYVMTREPLAAKFTIFAPDSFSATFTPDSQSIVFYTPTLRIESWSIADELRTSVVEMQVANECLQSALSADGKYLACFTSDWALIISEVATGEVRFQKKNFSQPDVLQYYATLLQRFLDPEGAEFIHMRFSPDGRYFVAHGSQDATIALELDGFKTFSLPSATRELMWGNFTFVGADKIAGADLVNPKNSGIVKFPSGESVRRVAFGNTHLEATADSRHIILRPVKEHVLGVMDAQTGIIGLGFDKRALDVFGDVYVHERSDGDLTIRGFKDAKEIARIKLPMGQLGYLRSANVSPDLRWLAISEQSRGGLWDLAKGERVFYTRGFTGATVSPQGVVQADFAKFQDTKRQIARMDPAARRIDPGTEIGDQQLWQFGNVLLRSTHNAKNDWKHSNIRLEASDVSSNKTLWSREFPKEAPRYLSSRSEGNLVLEWPANSDGAKLEIKNDPVLSAAGARLQGGSEDYFIEVIEPVTGKLLSALVIRTGKRAFRLLSAESSGDWFVAADSRNRLLVYSLSSGEQAGILFGRKPVISGSASLLAAENERGQLLIYDLQAMSRRQEYFFTSRIAYTYFAPDNRRIFVLTGDQTAYFLAVPKPPEKSKDVAAN
jgi:hypothetical protein